ncbi:Foldase protein prsA precursor [Bacteroidales bacterium Barb6XT]|nr:Foldase protein prsA precursor [Bacteroidales bacterium Barb6XT]
MATLEKIRSKAGLLVGIVGLALFAFIIGDFLNSGSTFLRQSAQRIASVDGTVINIENYQSRIDEMAEVYKMQSGTSSLPEETMTQIRESVYESMVREIVMGETTAKLGLGVSPEELFDMVQGENISPMIRQMPIFQNEQGVFDKTVLLQILKAIDEDNIANSPADRQAQLLSIRNFWLFWEKNIKQQRLEEKFTNLLSKAVSANKLDAKENFSIASETSDIAYTMQSYSTIPDSTVAISKSEIEKLYNQRKEKYKQKESKVIDYIAVDIVPSEQDFEQVRNDIESLREEFVSSENVADLVNENSDVPFTNVFFSESTFDPALKEFVATAETGTVEGPLFADNTYRMFKLIDKKVAPDSVKVSHIMIAGLTEEQAVARADSLLDVLKNGGDFAALAKEFSADQSAAKEGELGWFTEATALRNLNEEFKDAVFSAAVNEIKKVKSLYGTHLVKVTEKTGNVAKYKVADLNMPVSPSSVTFSNLYNSLNQFLSGNNTLEKFKTNAQEAGYSIQSDVPVTATDQTIGMIKSTRSVVRWAFENSKGTISDIFECGDKFIVAVVEGTVREGYRPLNDDLSASLKPELIAQKKGQIIADELKAKNLTSLTAYADAMKGRVDSVKFVGFNTSRISGIGAEPKLNAIISLSETGKLSRPVIGSNGVYVFEVLQKNTDAREYDEEAQIRNLNVTNNYRFGYQAVQSLIDKADVEDTRIRFY